MMEMELLVDFHKDANRQGPGSSSETKKALSLIDFGKSNNLNVADIGCGTGAQTITIAENINGYITAVDLFPEFLEQLEIKAKDRGLHHRINTKACSMDNLPFADEEFDLIWSEGAIYILGFEKGVQEWRRFLKGKGFLAVTEISWITDSRPKEVEDYWLKEYPQIDTISNKIEQLESNGYYPTAHFILPEYCWIDNYYRPMQERIPDFLAKHKNSQPVRELMEAEKEEIRIYEKYKEYYSYVFYIAQKR